MADFATVEDVTLAWRSMTDDEEARAVVLLETVSSILRFEADKVGKDLDALVEADENYAIVVRSVTVDVVARALMTPTTGAPMTQFSESAMGYSVSGNYLIPGGGLFVKRSELARLGIARQRIGSVDLCQD